MEKIISVQNLRKSYQKTRRTVETAVENVCFELMPGNIMGLLGTNGAGKTTTLKMITNLCAKDNGEIIIDNISLDENPGLALSQVGAALDTPCFYQELTARENIECFAHLYQNIPDRQVMELLEYVGLTNHADKKVKTFSLGMKQRLALARAMLGYPKLIILDEPANGLDPQGQINLYRLICNLAEEKNTTFIVSSHQLHDMEKFCTDILILNKGKSILQGKTEEILSETTNIVDCILEEAKTAKNVLSQCHGIRLISQKGNQFTIRLEKIDFDEFIKNLIRNHLHIRYLSMRKNSLQDIFLKLTGGV
ncbi:MAG: ABC transporter ATP-binding protein [Blautia sp.]|nr:ABC transporter ATP-binding protein [Lachnoclostridium sp.]MCM1210306.1 ABC transporter ATP-binding protein [Blautia sp.]